MGGGSGPGSPARSIDENSNSLEREFGQLRNGYFGERGSSSRIRRIVSVDPVASAKLFFNLARKGAPEPRNRESSRGDLLKLVTFKDGSTVGLRLSSKDGSPSLEISSKIAGGKVKTQKIHFVRSSS